MKKNYFPLGLTVFLILFMIFGNILPVFSHTHHQIVSAKPKQISLGINHLDETIKIVSPLSTVPFFVLQGGSFHIKFQAVSVNKVYAYITTSYEPLIDEIFLDILEIHKSNNTYLLTVSVPPETPEELYNLTVLIDVENTLYSSTNPRAVKVLTQFPHNFTFAHITDFHVGDPRGLKENINQTIGWKSIKKCIEEINLLQPDFVIISGDLVYGQLYPYEYSREYKKCYEILQLFDVPTFLCPGNHDGYNRFKEDGLDFWKTYFGPLYYSFDYGNYHFTAINSYEAPASLRACLLFIPLNWGGYISDSQLDWIETDLASHQNQSLFLFLHHNPIWETVNESFTGQSYLNRKELQILASTYGVDMVLAGHIHRDSVNIVNDTVYLTTTTPGSEIRNEDGYWGFRMIDIKKGKVVTYNYKDPKYSIPTYHLNYTIEYQGTIATATIDNSLDINITAHIKFIMPGGEYAVDRGAITMIRTNDSLQEIYVSSLVEKNHEVTVTLCAQP